MQCSMKCLTEILNFLKTPSQRTPLHTPFLLRILNYQKKKINFLVLRIRQTSPPLHMLLVISVFFYLFLGQLVLRTFFRYIDNSALNCKYHINQKKILQDSFAKLQLDRNTHLIHSMNQLSHVTCMYVRLNDYQIGLSCMLSHNIIGCSNPGLIRNQSANEVC